MSEVFIVGFNGSPRKNGNTMKMLSVALKAAEYEGANTKIYHLYDYEIKQCKGCLCDDLLRCKYPCEIEDDMKLLYDEIIKADGLIIASPIYWYNVSAPVKNLIDRMTIFENSIFIEGNCPTEGKVAGIIAAGNDSGCISVISNLYAVLNSMGFSIPPWALAYKNSNRLLDEEENRVLDAANVGRVVTIMAKVLKDKKIGWFNNKLLEKLHIHST